MNWDFIWDFIYCHSLLFVVGMILILVWVVALVGQLLIARVFPLKDRRAHNEILGHAAGISGVVNAVLLAFIVFAAWTDYDRARDVVSQEASLVIDIWRDLEAPVKNGGQEVRALHDSIVPELERYLWTVNHEWKKTRTGTRPNKNTFRKGWGALTKSYNPLLSPNGETSLRPAVAEELIKRFNSLFDARRQRIAYSKHGSLIDTVWAVVLAGGLVSIASCWLFGFESRKLHAASTTLVASSFGLVFFLIIALQWPFRGEKQISETPYCDALWVILRAETHEQWKLACDAAAEKGLPEPQKPAERKLPPSCPS